LGVRATHVSRRSLRRSRSSGRTRATCRSLPLPSRWMP